MGSLFQSLVVQHLANRLMEILMESIATLVNCPSCGFGFCILGPDCTTLELPSALLAWKGGPDIVCPQCDGHSPREAFFVHPDNSLPDQIVTTDEDVEEEDLTPSEGLAFLDETAPFTEEDAKAAVEALTLKPIFVTDDPHGRDPEEGTSRPYPFSDPSTENPMTSPPFAIEETGENSDGS